jgi:hypothetical protein
LQRFEAGGAVDGLCLWWPGDASIELRPGAVAAALDALDAAITKGGELARRLAAKALVQVRAGRSDDAAATLARLRQVAGSTPAEQALLERAAGALRR